MEVGMAGSGEAGGSAGAIGDRVDAAMQMIATGIEVAGVGIIVLAAVIAAFLFCARAFGAGAGTRLTSIFAPISAGASCSGSSFWSQPTSSARWR
jgi:hypothetical protein